jgi:F-type H+-transporting ATPase subunit b
MTKCLKMRRVAAMFVLAAAAFVYSPNRAPAQQNAPQQQGQPPDGSQPQSIGSELAHESREAAGEDPNAKLKESDSVKLISRLTGLDVHASYWLAIILNFAVIAGFVIWIWRTRLPSVFSARRQSIHKALEEARKASEEANRRLSDIESRLAKLDTEINAMRQSAEQEIAAEEARIKAATEEDVQKVVASAEQEIAAAAKSARRDLKAYAAGLAVSLAQKQIHVDTSTDQELVRNFAAQIAASGNGSGKETV